jgi:hypothetical protein
MEVRDGARPDMVSKRMGILPFIDYRFFTDAFIFKPGLTLLLPVIINSRSNWSDTRLRIFCAASGVQELEKEQKGFGIAFFSLLF